MKITCVGIESTAKQLLSLTPEMLAAVGARYSRNDEGLEAILAKVEGMDPDKAVDSIFKMVDYGHRSISDMAPVAMFLDGISLWAALRIWYLCPTAGGQETSTRYVKMGIDKVYKPPVSNQKYDNIINDAFRAYEAAYDLWTELAKGNPEIMGIPEDLILSTERSDVLKLDRMRRNFGFDRSRYFLPMCCKTNVMLIMPARAWVDLIKMLYSDPNAEAVAIAEEMVQELEKVTPRLTKHARYDSNYGDGFFDEFKAASESAEKLTDEDCVEFNSSFPQFHVYPAMSNSEIARALEHHNNRYGYFGKAITMTPVRFGWANLTLAELRDLNRHRTGSKNFSLNPRGLYLADDEISRLSAAGYDMSLIRGLRVFAADMIKESRKKLLALDASFVYCLPMGAQVSYEHTTTADKFLYQCELRTGLGAHYTYAQRMREVLELWHQQFPETRNLIKPGLAEPE